MLEKVKKAIETLVQLPTEALLHVICFFLSMGVLVMSISVLGLIIIVITLLTAVLILFL